MDNNSWYKKEKPLLGLLGSGGGLAQGGAAPPVIDASGGTKATPGDGYTYHVFTSSGSFVVASGTDNMDILMVGGGGGGGFDRGGGGGGGAFRPETFAGEPGTHPVTIGAGGNGGTGSPGGTVGGNTTFVFISTPYIAGGGGCGGGTGGSPGPGTPGNYGGSGGGAGRSNTFSAGTVGGPDPTYTPYGHPGKLSFSDMGAPVAIDDTGGGGGGAGLGGSPTMPWPYAYTAPTPGQVDYRQINASDGKTLPWIPARYGISGWFAGGGGGGGGVGAGNAGALPSTQKAGAGRGASPTVTSTAAYANTGSGGGGGSGGPPHDGKNGAAGVVLIRYPVGT